LPIAEQMPLVLKPEYMPLEHMHMTIQGISNGKNIILTEEQAAQALRVLEKVIKENNSFAIDTSTMEINIMGNFIALHFSIPKAFKDLHDAICQALKNESIPFGPQYDSLKLHVSIMKSKNSTTKAIAYAILQDALSKDMVDKRNDIRSIIPVTEVVISSRDPETKKAEIVQIIPLKSKPGLLGTIDHFLRKLQLK
jgi:hypothetical protein